MHFRTTVLLYPSMLSFFFFHAPPTTEIYTLSLHDALPIFRSVAHIYAQVIDDGEGKTLVSASSVDKGGYQRLALDRKSTRLNSSHVKISYAVFCLKKKKKKHNNNIHDDNNDHL